MKKALSCKIIFLFTVFALSLALAFSFGGKTTAHADDITVPSTEINSYFSGAEFELNGTDLVAKVEKDGEHRVTVAKTLVIDDFAVIFSVPAEVKSFTVTLTSDSYFVEGAYKNEKFDVRIENVLTVDMENKTVDLNGVSVAAPALAAGELTVAFSTADNVLSADVAGEHLENTDDYYKIGGADKCAASVVFDFELTDDAEITFKSFDQKYSDGTGAYKQTFALDTENNITVTKPRVAVSNANLKKTGVNAFKAVYGKDYALTFTVYSLLGNAGSVYVDKDSVDANAVWVDPSTDKPKNIEFENDAATTFGVKTENFDGVEEYTVTTAVLDDDIAAPYYIDYAANTNVYTWYNILVRKAALKNYGTDDEEDWHSIRLGDSYTVPSLQNLVEDDLNAYSDLTYTVYYRTPSNASGSTSSLKFTVSEAGVYEFYVVFKDKNGNAMQKDDFYTIDEHDSEIRVFGIYEKAVFTFTVEDDAPISVEAPASQGKGYLNTKYTATSFTIKSSGNNVKYTLYYNPAGNATEGTDGWIVLPQLSEITEDYNENGFTYSDIQTLNYDGTYTFTPVKLGSYKIECNVTSDNQVRSATASTIINVADKPTVVKVDTHWFRNNLWSIIFLSVGTLSLIGIIILLFIKPKEETETDDTGDALNVNSKR